MAKGSVPTERLQFRFSIQRAELLFVRTPKFILTIMKLLQRVFLLCTASMAGFVLSGCPLLMIGGLGYTGYQYHEKEGVFAPGQPLGGQVPDDQCRVPGPRAWM